MNYKGYIKVCLYAILIGFVIGFTMLLFNFLVMNASLFRRAHNEIIYLLPLAGLLIVAIYKYFNITSKIGSSMIFDRIQQDKSCNIFNTFAVLVTTCISHLFGASVGRTNATFQIGGGLADFIGNKLDISEEDKKILVIAGVAAGFSTLFGTPLAAAFLACEVITIGEYEYKAFIPCLITSYISISINRFFHLKIENYNIVTFPQYNLHVILDTLCLAVICSVVAILFCILLKNTIKVFSLFNNKYIKIFVGGSIVVLFYAIFGNNFEGGGANIVKISEVYGVVWYAFIIKMIITVICSASGFQGGMVTPVLFIGGSLGGALSGFFDLDPSYCAAIGMICLFVGVINAKYCAIIMSIELFGIEGIVFCLFAILIAHELSLNFKIFDSQDFKDDKAIVRIYRKYIGGRL